MNGRQLKPLHNEQSKLATVHVCIFVSASPGQQKQDLLVSRYKYIQEDTVLQKLFIIIF